MKKIVLLMIAVAGLTQVSKAQEFGFKKGDVFVEGAVQVNTQNNKNTEVKTNSFTISPVGGYFLSDKIAVGLNPSFSQTKKTDYSGSTDAYTQSHSFGIGVFGRYYLLQAGSRFDVYSELDLGYASARSKSHSSSNTSKSPKTNSFGASAGIGANYFLTPRIAVGYKFADVIDFTTTKVDQDNAKANNSFNVNLNNFSNFFSTGQFSLTYKF